MTDTQRASAAAAPPADPAPADAAHAGPADDAAPAPPAPTATRPSATAKGAAARDPRMDPMHVVEAALFSAGRPISVLEIQEETGLDQKTIKKTIEALRKAYQERDTALEIGPAGSKWSMQVRSMVSEPAARFAPMEIPKKVLKTLALVAYHQPLKQSDLKEMIGSKVYDHVGELVERGLVRARAEGVTKLLTTTPAFPEYFGIPGEDMEAIRGQMAALVGLPPPEKKGAEVPHGTPKALEEFAQAALQAAQAEAQDVERPAADRESAAVPRVPEQVAAAREAPDRQERPGEAAEAEAELPPA